MLYADYRERIQTGDIILLPGSAFIGGIVRRVTHSDFAHCGVLWRMGSHVYLLDADPVKGVKCAPLSRNLPGLVVHTRMIQTTELEDAAWMPTDTPYDWVDAIRSGVGLPGKDTQRYQCAEYVSKVLRAKYGDLPEIHTPQRLYEWSGTKHLITCPVY